MAVVPGHGLQMVHSRGSRKQTSVYWTVIKDTVHRHFLSVAIIYLRSLCNIIDTYKFLCHYMVNFCRLGHKYVAACSEFKFAG